MIEGQLLRIAQAGGEELHLRAVGVAAKHRAAVRHVERRAAFDRHIGRPIADGEIEFSIRSKDEAVHVVAEKSGTEAEPLAQ